MGFHRNFGATLVDSEGHSTATGCHCQSSVLATSGRKNICFHCIICAFLNDVFGFGSIPISMAAFDLNKFVANPTLSQFDKCSKDDLCVIAIAEYYGISVSRSLVKRELKTVILNGLVSKGVFNLPASVKSPGSVIGTMAAISSSNGHCETAQPSGAGHSDPRVGEPGEQQPVGFTPGVMSSETVVSPFLALD